MFGLGIPELLIILVIVVMVFGAGKLPQLGQALGSGIHDFKKAIRGEDDPPKNALPGKDNESPKKP